MMKQNLILLLIACACAAALLPSASLANQMGPGRAQQINALGISVDYARTWDKNDIGLYASYRYGFLWLISLFFSADAGYRFLDHSVNARIGGQAMFVFIGLEAGLLFAYRTIGEHNEWHERTQPPGPCAPGIYIGLAGVIPVKPMAVFLSTGGNFYFINHDHEFYFMATVLVNFARL